MNFARRKILTQVQSGYLDGQMHFFVGVAFVAALALLLVVEPQQTNFGFNFVRQFLLIDRRSAPVFAQENVDALIQLLFFVACAT